MDKIDTPTKTLMPVIATGGRFLAGSSTRYCWATVGQQLHLDSAGFTSSCRYKLKKVILDEPLSRAPITRWHSPLDTASLKPKSIPPKGGDALRLVQPRR